MSPQWLFHHLTDTTVPTLTLEVSRENQFQSCNRCGHQWLARSLQLPAQCPKCKHSLWRETPTQSQAQQAVRRAIKRGEFLALNGNIPCVDCGQPAKVYDHRNYTHPLMVDAVCMSCNAKRGEGRNPGEVVISFRVAPDVANRIRKLASERHLSAQACLIDPVIDGLNRFDSWPR